MLFEEQRSYASTGKIDGKQETEGMREEREMGDDLELTSTDAFGAGTARGQCLEATGHRDASEKPLITAGPAVTLPGP